MDQKLLHRAIMRSVLCVAAVVAVCAAFPGTGPGIGLGLGRYAASGSRVFAATRDGQTQQAKKRLILKDGTYLDVARFKVRDGRVRYLSTEGGAWQEMPASSVDWKATKQWNRAHPHGVTGDEGQFENISPAQAQQEITRIDNEEHARRAALSGMMPVVKPGLRLPDEGGIFALDAFHGHPELVHLRQADGDLNQNPFHSVQAVDVDRMHAFAEVVQMQEVHAAVQLHTAKPVFYVSVIGHPEPTMANAFVVNANVGPSKPGAGEETAHSRFVIVRVVRQGQSRVIFAEQLRNAGEPDARGDRTQTQESLLPGGYWKKITAVDTLAPGEYALVEVFSPQEVNRDVWDFGVNATAPDNQGAILPVQ